MRCRPIGLDEWMEYKICKRTFQFKRRWWWFSRCVWRRRVADWSSGDSSLCKLSCCSLCRLILSVDLFFFTLQCGIYILNGLTWSVLAYPLSCQPDIVKQTPNMTVGDARNVNKLVARLYSLNIWESIHNHETSEGSTSQDIFIVFMKMSSYQV